MDIDTLEKLLAIGASLGLFLLWIVHTIVAPIQTALSQLNESIDKLEKTIREEQNRRASIELKLQSIGDREKESVRRIEEIEDMLKQRM